MRRARAEGGAFRADGPGRRAVHFPLATALRAGLWLVLLGVTSAAAEGIGSYGAAAKRFDLPPITESFLAAVEVFPETGLRAGNFELAGRALVLVDRDLYLQRARGSGAFVRVGRLSEPVDPSFVRISPDGSRIALGLGFARDLLVVPTSLLDPASPPLLDAHPAVDRHAVGYFDAAWLDADSKLVLSAFSGVTLLDLARGTSVPLVVGGPLDAAGSGGVAVVHRPGAASDGALLVGIGFDPDTGRTGEIRAFSGAAVAGAAASGTPLDFDAGAIVAERVLSAASLAVDPAGNLVVGGGDFLSADPAENGYAALIAAEVIDGALAGTGGPVDESDPDAYREFAPDPCGDDTSTGALVAASGPAVGVMFNPNEGRPCQGVASDLWLPGSRPAVTLFAADGASDGDGDGIPDLLDNAGATYNPDQRDSDGDGYADVADADLDGDGRVGAGDFFQHFRPCLGADAGASPGCAAADFDGDGSVGIRDFFTTFRPRFGTEEPFE